MITSLISLALNKPVPANLSMTGEVTLTGKILPIGGVREKVIAAKRSAINVVLLPKDNERDWVELPEHIKQGVEVHFVDYYRDIFNLVWPNFSKETTNNITVPPPEKIHTQAPAS